MLRYFTGSRSLDKKLRETHQKEIKIVELNRTQKEWEEIIKKAKEKQAYWSALSETDTLSFEIYDKKEY